MSEFDPVPPEYLLPSAVVEKFIPVRFLDPTVGDPTARELALQVLVDDDPKRQREIQRFQHAGRGDVANFFRFMNETVLGGVGRHSERMIAVACLHPERDTTIDIAHASERYLQSHGSLED